MILKKTDFLLGSRNPVELTLYIEYPKHREMTSKRKTERFEKEEEEKKKKKKR